MKLEQAGVYIAEDTRTQEQYLVNITGKNPLLKVKSVISISTFVNNINSITDSQEVLIEYIEDNVNILDWTPFDAKVSKREEPITTVEYKFLKENRDKIIEAIRNDSEDIILMEFCKEEGIPVSIARTAFTQYKLSL